MINETNLKPVWFGQKILQEKTTVADAFEKVGLSWKVVKEPIYMSNGNGGFVPVDDFNFTVRNDLQGNDLRRVLGVMGSRYVPIQNAEAFSVIDNVINESDSVVETAGVLKNGRIVYLLINMPGKATIGDDSLEKYILVTNRHDGKGCMKALFTNVRVVCMNTLMQAINTAQHGLNIQHSNNKNAQISMARKLLADSSIYYREIIDVYKELAAKKITDAFFKAYLEVLVPNKTDEESTKTTNIRNRISALYHGEQAGYDMDCIKGTAWGAYNATTQFIDHERTTRARGETTKVESRIDSVLFGSGATMRQKAFNMLCQEAGVDNRVSLTEEALATN